MPEENVVKMRREIKIHDNKKRKEKRKRMQKDEQTRTLTSVFSLKKKQKQNRRRRKQNKTPVSQQGASNRSPNPSQSAFILLSCFLNFQ